MNSRKFEIDQKAYLFDKKAYKSMIDRKLISKTEGSIKKISKEQYYEELSEALSVSSSTVKSWYYEQNGGPSDLDLVKSLAIYWHIDYMSLLKPVKEDIIMSSAKYSEKQMGSLYRIYKSIICFLDEFEHTDGFNNWWYEMEDEGIRPADYLIEEKAMKLMFDVEKIFKSEYFYLHGMDVYEKLQDYIYDFMPDMFMGKCSYAYRFEAGIPTVDGKIVDVTTSEDLVKAEQLLEEIMEQYVWE